MDLKADLCGIFEDSGLSLHPVEFIEEEVCLCGVRVRDIDDGKECNLICVNTGNPSRPSVVLKGRVKDGEVFCQKRDERLLLLVCAKRGFKTRWYLRPDGGELISAAIVLRPIEMVSDQGVTLSLVLREIGANIVELAVSGLSSLERVRLISISEDERLEWWCEADIDGMLRWELAPAVIGKKRGRASVTVVRSECGCVDPLSLSYEWDVTTWG